MPWTITSDLHSKLGERGPISRRVRNAIWTQTHAGPFRFRTPMQKASIFYMPDLEALSVTSRERLAWAAAVEKATDDIRSEYLAAVAANVPHAPYVEANTRSPVWQTLRGKPDWSALHLLEEAEDSPSQSCSPGHSRRCRWRTSFASKAENRSSCSFQDSRREHTFLRTSALPTVG